MQMQILCKFVINFLRKKKTTERKRRKRRKNCHGRKEEAKTETKWENEWIRIARDDKIMIERFEIIRFFVRSFSRSFGAMWQILQIDCFANNANEILLAAIISYCGLPSRSLAILFSISVRSCRCSSSSSFSDSIVAIIDVGCRHRCDCRFYFNVDSSVWFIFVICDLSDSVSLAFLNTVLRWPQVASIVNNFICDFFFAFRL